MKSINKSPTKKRKILIIVVVVLVILAALLIVYVAYGNPFKSTAEKAQTEASPDTAITTQEETAASTDAKENTVKDESSSSPVARGENLIVTIPAKAQNGNTVQIRASIDAVSNTGSCTLTLSKSSTVVTRTASIQGLPSTSTCQGFDIATSDLSSGEWQIAIDVVINDRKGRATSSVLVQ